MSAVALLLIVSAIPMGARAEIPHENYDLASSDLDTVIALLNSSIRSFESSYRALDDEDAVLADQYLDRVGSVLTPAEGILSEIEDVAGSYDELSALLPPFASLYDESSLFLEKEFELLEARTHIVSSSELENLSDEQLIDALDAIARFNSIIDQMNSTIDDMLVHAHAIDALTIDDSAPFVPNELVELIEQLRLMLHRILADMEQMMDDGIPWDTDVSFLLLWISDTSLHLGDTILGGGYLFVGGTFATGEDIDVYMDGTLLLSVTTGSAGRYEFSRFISLNESWLGTHVIVAQADPGNGTIASNPVTITISLIPTTIRLSADTSLLAPTERVNVVAKLRDDRGLPLPGMDCTLALDGDAQAFVTDEQGSEAWSWTGSSLGYGSHSFSASYEAVLPYASSTSNTVSVVVDIPTNVTLNLFSDRLREGYYVIGNGTLKSNGTEPMASRNISLYVDGVYFQDARTQSDGVFAFSISTENLTEGTHVLRASFDKREDIWRHSDAEVTFVIVSMKYSDYPFFPWIPGWNIGLGEQIPYLFFGENAYYTWMFIILVIGIVVKALQVRKSRRARAAEGAAPPDETVEGLEEEWAPETRDWLPERAPDWITGPNERIVWHYSRMISFLRKRRKVGITDNMTHWEVARLLLSLGYSEATIKRVTMLFETAYYSSTTLSEADVIQMGSAAHSVKRSGGVKPAV